MGHQIPKALEPHFNSIIANANSHTWLVDFYLREIHDEVVHTIEMEIFQSPAINAIKPFASTLDKLTLLQHFFDPIHKNHACFLPLRQLFSSISNKHKVLQDSWIKAMASREEMMDLSEGLPSYTFEVLREVMMREILLYMQNQLASLKPAHRKRHKALQYWLDKELGHLGPIAQTSALDNQRFEKIHDPSHYEFDVAALFSDAWYFVNGVHRTPLFLQNELLSLQTVLNDFRYITKGLSKDSPNFTKLLLYGLPMSCLKFMLTCGYMMFAPYRLARTMVNELTDLIRLTLQSLVQKFELKASNEWLSGLTLATEWLCYGGLLWSFGLPLLPNPFAWMPSVSAGVFALAALGYLASATAGACMMAATKYMKHDPIFYLHHSVRNVERQVEKGIQAVDKVHQEIFEPKAKPITPGFAKHAASSPEHVAKHQPVKPIPRSSYR